MDRTTVSPSMTRMTLWAVAPLKSLAGNFGACCAQDSGPVNSTSAAIPAQIATREERTARGLFIFGPPFAGSAPPPPRTPRWWATHRAGGYQNRPGPVVQRESGRGRKKTAAPRGEGVAEVN